jgi:hypothetical protein
MVYHIAKLGPTHGQMDDLARGEEVKLSHHHMSGEVTFHLTTAQMKKLETAKAGGRGCTLKLSKAQIMKHMKGEGFFSDVARKVWDTAKPLAQKGLHAGVQWAADKAEDAIAHKTGLRGSGFFGDIVKGAGHAGVDGLAGALGLGVRPKRAPKKKGDGLLDVLGLGVHPHEAHMHHAHMHHAKKGKGLLDMFGLGVKPHHKKGKGFLGNILKGAGHAGVDGLAGALGLGVAPNPLRNYNEQLAATTRQKKGAGLYL